MNDEQHLLEVLDDLCTRFLVNLPSSEYESFERLFFAIESAHWFYDDFCREKDHRLPKLPLNAFAVRLFDHTPLLHQYRSDVDRLVADFKSYKQEVPTCGAAMLNEKMDKVLVVRGWGPGAKWGFPKGKVAKDETELQAAIREVLEETGFDLSDYTDESTFYLDSMAFGRLNRIFVVPGVPEDAHFETQTRKEISDMAWIAVDDLPEHQKKRDPTAPPPPDIIHSRGRIPYNKIYFHVAPYSVRLKAWVKRQRRVGEDGQRGSKAFSSARKNIGPESSERTERTHRGKTGVKVQGSEGVRVPQGSPQRGKKNRKDRRKQESKDVETFGTEGRAGCLSAAERDTMFQNYVRDSDKRAKELCLAEDMWPSVLHDKLRVASGVPEDRQGEHSEGVRAQGEGALKGWTGSGDAGIANAESAGCEKGEAEGTQMEREEISLFTFDAKAIVSRMLNA